MRPKIISCIPQSHLPRRLGSFPHRPGMIPFPFLAWAGSAYPSSSLTPAHPRFPQLCLGLVWRGDYLRWGRRKKKPYCGPFRPNLPTGVPHTRAQHSLTLYMPAAISVWLPGNPKARLMAHTPSLAGNHAQAIALAARTAGIPAHIVMPTITPRVKIESTRALGATVYFSGSTAQEREEVAARVVAETGGRYVPPYDHPDIILGQGTLGLEMQEQVASLMAGRVDGAGAGGDFIPRPADDDDGPYRRAAGKKGLDAIMAPCSGGGMLSGVALSCEGTGVRVFGAEPEFEGADDTKRSFESGVRVTAVRSLTIADGLRAPVGALPWSVMYERRLVERIFSVTEDEIRAALRLVLERFKLVVEPSAAVGLAVALFNEDFRAMVEREAGDDGWDLGLVLSGGNIELASLASLLGEGTPVPI
ncbi:hypothetical protein RB595_002433 [Gaeumannomyces hyphopodioides]